MLDRTLFTEELAAELVKGGGMDLRVGQVFELLRSRLKDDLWNIENEQLLKLLKEFNSEAQ